MTIKTIQEYAISKGTTPQNIRNKKSISMVKCPIYALYNGKYVLQGEQLFVECENNQSENQSLTK